LAGDLVPAGFKNGEGPFRSIILFANDVAKETNEEVLGAVISC
jgi:hypothetical protein